MAKSSSAFSRAGFSPLILLAFFILIFVGDTLHLFEHQELGLVDLRFRLRPPRMPHSDIVVVEIDDQSINRIGHWPWPRSYHATLLTLLSEYKPRIVLYDVLFTEASLQPQDDELFAYSLKKAGNVILAF